MPRKKIDVAKRLQQKGFTLKVSKDHKYFFVYNSDGTKTIVNTKISHSSNNEIHDGLLNSMMKQIRLKKPEFDRYMDCTLSKEMYLDILKNKGLYH